SARRVAASPITAAMSAWREIAGLLTIVGLLTDGRAQTLGGRAVEVAENPRVVRGQLSFDALLVEGLEQALRWLAQRGGLADQHRHRFAYASMPEQRATQRVVAVRPEVREVPPERNSVVPKRLLDGLAIGRRAPAPPQRDLAELRQRFVCLRHPLLGRPEPPPDGHRQTALGPQASRIDRAREILRPRVPRLGGGEELRRRLGIALHQPQHEREVVARIVVLRVAREDTTVCVDRPVEVALRVAHDAQAVVRLTQV